MKRFEKQKNAVKRMRIKPVSLIGRSQMDIMIFEVVLQSLYNNAHLSSLDLEKDIYKPNQISLPDNEKERIWDLLSASGLINSMIGFGNSGKIELSKTGNQLMSQFGSYINYLKANNAIPLPLQEALLQQQKQLMKPKAPEEEYYKEDDEDDQNPVSDIESQI